MFVRTRECSRIWLVVLLFIFTIPAIPQTVDPSFAPLLQSFGDTQGRPSAKTSLRQPDGKILVGGAFTVAEGRARSGIARFNPDGTVDPTFDAGDIGVADSALSLGSGGVIEAIRLQSDGKILIAGNYFREVDGPRLGIERLNPDGSLDPTFDPPDNLYGISDIEIQADGKIVIGGGFELNIVDTTTGQTLRYWYLARLNPDGSLDAGFRPSALQNSNSVVIQPDGKIVVGNAPTNADPEQLIRFNPDGSREAVLTTFDGWVMGLELLPDGKFVVVGTFIFVDGVFQKFVVRLNSNGSRDTSFASTVGFVNGLGFLDVSVQADGKVIVCGDFHVIDTFTRWRVARFNADGSMDTTFNTSTPIAGGVGDVLALPDGSVFIGGAFPRPSNTEFYSNIGRLNADGSYDASFPGYVIYEGEGNSIVRQPDGKVLIGGFIYYANNLRRRGIVRYNADGSLDTGFMPSTLLSNVLDIALQPDGKIMVVNSDSPSTLHRLNPDGSIDSSFSSPFVNFSASINRRTRITEVVVQPDGKILVGGLLITGSASSPSLSGLARLQPNGSVEWLVGALGGIKGVYDIGLQPDGKIVIGGDFSRINNDSSYAGLARINANGTPDPTFRPAVPGTVLELELQSDRKIVYGGNFGAVQRVNADGVNDPTFNATVDDRVEALRVQPDDKIVVGGLFRTVNGVPRRRVGRLNANGTLDTGFNVPNGANNVVYDFFVEPAGSILVAGAFTKIGNAERFGAARLLATATGSTVFDFDGDGKTDVAIFRPSVAEWWISRSLNGSVIAAQFGATTDKIVPADYTGDGKVDVAVWRPSSGEWFVLRSEDSSFYSVPFGTDGDIPVPADYDADGKADAAVFRPSTGTWFISRSTGGTTIQGFGTNGDIPVVADYDGDDRADIAIYRPATGEWWLNRSTSGVIAMSFGNSTDKPVPGDYTGDGKTDVAFWRPATGEWYVLRSEDFSYYSVPFGTTGDVPAPGDYDGDGKFDTTVFRSSNATWYIGRTTAGTQIFQFGSTGDRPVPNAFVP